MELQLTGRRALVTGSSSGLGAATAARLAREGAIVTVQGRNAERAQAVAETIRQTGGEAHVAIGDLATEAGADQVAAAVQAGMGPVDILVNNAGGFEAATTGLKAWFDTAPGDWTSTYEANVAAAARMVRRFAPQMQARGWGRIIQVSSTVAANPSGYRPDYETAKAAVNNLTLGLAKALAGSGVTVNTVTPGAMRTPALMGVMRETAGKLGWTEQGQALEDRYVSEIAPAMAGRIGDGDEVAVVIAFLASPLARFVNGACIQADGGPA
jgi:3-oxoacyl-[acyl-carrier protein] reductase